MTDSELLSPPEWGLSKRERLVAGARRVLHEQGVERTTLADIAAAADVPVGNVYYYFKTKDELVAAVIEAHAEDARARLASLERHRTPKARLKAFVQMLGDQREVAARDGCPHGSLCSELDKRDLPLAGMGAELIRIPIEWAEAQFRALGRRDAHELAVALIASYQGISLLTNTLRDPQLMAREVRRLGRWIDDLSDPEIGGRSHRPTPADTRR
jgi:TetR/AcrR family transcriptional regulator, transcriptional repressor for nem operon